MKNCIKFAVKFENDWKIKKKSLNLNEDHQFLLCSVVMNILFPAICAAHELLQREI